jgi:predicted ATPase
MHLKKVTLCPEKFPTKEHYPFNLILIQETKSLTFTSPVTFFVGENGSGKSTLLEAVTRKCGIMMWQGIPRPRYKASPYEKELYKAIDVKWQAKRVPGSFFGSHIFRNFAQLWDEWLTMDPGLANYLGGESFMSKSHGQSLMALWDEWLTMDPGLANYLGGESFMSKSHGQSLMAFFRSRFQIEGIYFLDEPETALSPKSQVELLKLIDDLLACPNARILNFDTSPVKQIDYKQTDHYRIYKDFMGDPGKYLTN